MITSYNLTFAMIFKIFEFFYGRLNCVIVDNFYCSKRRYSDKHNTLVAKAAYRQKKVAFKGIELHQAFVISFYMEVFVSNSFTSALKKLVKLIAFLHEKKNKVF